MHATKQYAIMNSTDHDEVPRLLTQTAGQTVDPGYVLSSSSFTQVETSKGNCIQSSKGYMKTILSYLYDVDGWQYQMCLLLSGLVIVGKSEEVKTALIV